MTEPIALAQPFTLSEWKELLAEKEQESERLRAQLAELWQQRQEGNLPREQYIDYLYAEDQLRVTLQQLEGLKPRVLYHEAEAAVTEGKQHFDSYCAPVTEAAEALCQRWVGFIEACRQLVALGDEQISLLWALPDRSGQPAFGDLPTGSEILQRVLGVAWPHQPGTLEHTATRSLQAGFTHGDRDRVVEMITGARPFPESLVRKFLAGYHFEEPVAAE